MDRLSIEDIDGLSDCHELPNTRFDAGKYDFDDFKFAADTTGFFPLCHFKETKSQFEWRRRPTLKGNRIEIVWRRLFGGKNVPEKVFSEKSTGQKMSG